MASISDYQYPSRPSGPQTGRLNFPDESFAFEVKSFLGAGGEANVHRISVEGIQGDFALKTPRSGWYGDRLDQFGAEVQLLPAGKPRHVLKPLALTDGVMPDGLATRALVLPLADETLANRIERRFAAQERFASHEAAEVMAQLTIGLRESGLVHRDIKPENVFLSKGTVLVGDWGLARNPGDWAFAAGSVDYMAPEAARPQAFQLTEKHDSYSVALIGYEMATGRVPRGIPDNVNDSDAFAIAASDTRVRTTRKDEHFDRILACATNPNPERRSSHLDVLTDLAAYPSVHRHLTQRDREELAKHLLERNPDGDRDPMLDLAAARTIAKRWEGGSNPNLLKQLSAHAETIEMDYGLVSPSFAAAATISRADLATRLEAAESVDLTGAFRGQVLKANAEQAAKIAAEQALKQRNAWRQAVDAKAFSPEQAAAIERAQGEAHLNPRNNPDGRINALYIASVYANDWETFRRHRAPEGDLFVRIEQRQGYVQHGHVTPGPGGLLRDGPWVTTDANDQVRAVHTYVRDRLQGEARLHDANGQLMQTITYQDGLKHGIERFYKDGKVKEQQFYERGARAPMPQTAVHDQRSTTRSAGR